MDRDTYIINLKEFIGNFKDYTIEELEMVEKIFDYLKIDTENNTNLIFEDVDSYNFGYFLLTILRFHKSIS